MWEYTDKVKDLFLHPKNVGEIENADASGEVGSIICGDALKLTLNVDKETGKITDAKFQTFGCASAIASSTAPFLRSAHFFTELKTNPKSPKKSKYLHKSDHRLGFGAKRTV